MLIEFWHNLNPLNTELNPICHLLALLGGATIVVVSRLRVKPNQKQSHYSPGQALRGFQESVVPRFQYNLHMKVVRVSALRTGRLYTPGNIPGTHFY